MKTIFLISFLIITFSLNLFAQGTSPEVLAFSIGKDCTGDTIVHPSAQDTAIVKIGKKEVKVIEHDGGTEILWGKDKHKKSNPDKFKGHWEGLELGFNSFTKPDYSLYSTKDFMSLNQGKSVEVNLNFYQLNIGLAKSYVGLISGMGLSFSNYRFENAYTIKKGSTMTEPVLLDYDNLSKTKLAVTWLNVPLLLEFQVPVNQKEGRLFINAGLIGGVKIGSHTKVKHEDTKDKDHSGFNMNSFNYSATARIGYKDICLFANYSLTPLFESGKGPGLTPFAIGISLLN